jgi:hypothetical protein
MLTLAIICLLIAFLCGITWQQNQRKNFVLLTGCALTALLPIIMLISGICSIVMFLRWLSGG